MAKTNKSLSKNQPVSLAEQEAFSYSPEIGTYYERVFGPEKIRVIPIEHKDKRTWEEARQGDLKLVLEDKNGQTLEVVGTRLVGRVLMYLQPYTNMTLTELKELPTDQLQNVLSPAVQKFGKSIKAMFDGEGRLQGVASTMHKQIPWSQIRQIFEQAVKDVCGQIVMPNGETAVQRWNYALPLKNKNVSAWVGVHAGNNIIQGRSGIHVWSRFRTEREEGGGIQRPACLNWCGMWQVPLQFFGIDVTRLNNLYKVLGEENVQALQLSQFHIKPDMTKFASEVKEQLTRMVKAVEAITPIIDKSIHSPLKKTEMEAILNAYKEKTNLPDYVIKQILEHVEDETVWSFSQAVSWVRTHGQFKEFKICKPIEDRELTRKLENIAGEVLSLTPTINDFHKKVGEFTIERLLPTAKATA